MNKFTCLVLVLSFVFMNTLSAQQIKDEKVSVAYTQLPSSPLAADFTTYSSIVYGSSSGLEDLGYNREGLAKSYMTVAGYKRIGDGGHFRISSYVGYPRILSAETKSYTKTETVNEKKVTKTYYKKVISYRVPFTYKVEDYKGNVLTSGTLTSEKTFDEFTDSTSPSYVNKQWAERGSGIMSRKYKSEVDAKLKDAAGKIRTKYSYSPRKINAQIEILGKKDRGTENFMKNYEIVKAAFATMKADENLDAVKEAVKPAIDFYLEEKNKWSAADKKEVKVRSACAYNLATIYYWLDLPDEAQKYANEVVELGYKDGRGKSLNRSIEGLRKSFKKNNTTSRHPYFDVSNAVPPGAATFGGLEESADDNGAAATELKGTMIDKSGASSEGTFAVTAGEGEELSFGPKGNVSFNYTKDGRATSTALAPEEMQSFQLNDRNFMVMDFVAGAKGNTESKPSILEVIYDGGSIKVFKYYPYDDALGDKTIEYAFQKAEDATPTSTSSTMFLLFNKGLQKYFMDCADLAEVAGTGEFKKTEDDIIRAARVYAEMCKAP